MSSGSIWSQWQGSDEDYALGRNTPVSHQGWSRWDYRGVHIEVLRHFGRYYLKGGYFFFDHRWQTHWEWIIPHPPEKDHAKTFYVHRHRATPTLGAGVELGQFYVDLNYYVEMNTGSGGAGIDAATTLMFGWKF